jgi:ATP-dependent Clp protease ATP-binding subunit ClpX
METTETFKPPCSFRKKTQDAVDVPIANPTDVLPRVYICDECMAVCQSILKERHAATNMRDENQP